jgi:ribonuclease-3
MLLEVGAKAAQVEQLTGYVFTNKLLAAEAVQMAAPQIAVIYGSFRGLPNNKRLSVLGDAVLAKTLCDLWFTARDRWGRYKPAISLLTTEFTKSGNLLNTSDWNTLRNDMLSNDNLAQRGYSLGVGSCVFCNEGTTVSAKMVAGTLQAIVGAVHQDGGDDAVLRVIEHLGFTQHPLLMVTLLTPLSLG